MLFYFSEPYCLVFHFTGEQFDHFINTTANIHTLKRVSKKYTWFKKKWNFTLLIGFNMEHSHNKYFFSQLKCIPKPITNFVLPLEGCLVSFLTKDAYLRGLIDMQGLQWSSCRWNSQGQMLGSGEMVVITAEITFP